MLIKLNMVMYTNPHDQDICAAQMQPCTERLCYNTSQIKIITTYAKINTIGKSFISCQPVCLCGFGGFDRTDTLAPPAVSGVKVPSPESYQQPIIKTLAMKHNENYKGREPNVYTEQRKEQRLPPAELTGVLEGKLVSHH